ncbi:hypothetical protein GC207_00785 [bacterium]|nr:hypothetical protein [bacterium]
MPHTSPAFSSRTSPPLPAAGPACAHRRPPTGRPAATARDQARRDGLTTGLIGIWSVVEPWLTYFVRKDRAQKKLVLRLEPVKCLHCYFYFLHEQLGLLHLRLAEHLPLCVEFVDLPEKVRPFIVWMQGILKFGHATIENVDLIHFGEPASGASFNRSGERTRPACRVRRRLEQNKVGRVSPRPPFPCLSEGRHSCRPDGEAPGVSPFR